MKLPFLIIGFLVLGLSLVPVQRILAAPILIADGSGQLLGAHGVEVGGTLYNVTFMDGTCLALFSGCDSVPDFMFTDSASALAASQALLDTVFIDNLLGNFDGDPTLTRGCTDALSCDVFTPYAFGDASNPLLGALVRNYASPFMSSDFTASPAGGLQLDSNTTSFTNVTYAVWASVPEPTTYLLLTMGLLSLIGYQWQRGRLKRQQIWSAALVHRHHHRQGNR